MIPGEILYADTPVLVNEGRPVTELTVLNTADRPVQVGSHYHFAEANPGLDFDRAAARGKRLEIAAGDRRPLRTRHPRRRDPRPAGKRPRRPRTARRRRGPPRPGRRERSHP